jgi:hypothetical protein
VTPAAWAQHSHAQLAALAGAGGTPGEQVASLVAALTAGRAPVIEGSLRRRASPVINRVDADRLAWVRRRLVDHGVKPALAAHRARVLCNALLGEFVRVANGGRPAGRAPWAELVRVMTGLS